MCTGMLYKVDPWLCEIGWNVFCLPSAGSKMQLFELILTQPGAYLLAHPCMHHEVTELHIFPCTGMLKKAGPRLCECGVKE